MEKRVSKPYVPPVLKGEYESHRKGVCSICPINTDGICNHKLWLSRTTNDVKTEPTPGYATGCGCVIKNKVLSPDSVCPVGKW